MHFDDKYLIKIIEKLDFNGKLALYQTCNRMRDFIGPIIRDEYQNNTFKIRPNLFETEQFLQFFGRYVSKIYFNMAKCDQIAVNWNLIYKWCGNNLMELTIKCAKTTNIHYLNQNGFSFPMLKSLTFKKSKINIYNGSSFNCGFCPNLVRLEFDENFELGEPVNLTNKIVLNRLKLIGFKRCNESVIHLLNAFDNTTKQSVDELTLSNTTYDEINDDEDYELPDWLSNSLVNSIAKFPNLIKLDLLFVGIKRFNTKYLFEGCSNLRIVSISIPITQTIPERLKYIKQFCWQLKKLQLVFSNYQWKYAKA